MTNPTTLDEARRLVALAEKAPITPAFISQLCTALPRLAADYIAAVERAEIAEEVIKVQRRHSQPDHVRKIIADMMEDGCDGWAESMTTAFANAEAARDAAVEERDAMRKALEEIDRKVHGFGVGSDNQRVHGVSDILAALAAARPAGKGEGE